MILSQEDCELFYKLNPALLVYANKKVKTIKGVETLDDFMDLALDRKAQIRNALYDNIQLVDSFIRENPNGFSDDELEIIRSWKHFIKDVKRDVEIARMAK